MKLFRIEHSVTGSGPFMSSAKDWCLHTIEATQLVMMDTCGSKKERPPMYGDLPHEHRKAFDDGKLWHLSCAFTSLSELRRWFEGVDPVFMNMGGYVVRCVEACDQTTIVGLSLGQAFFDKEKAQLIETVSWFEAMGIECPTSLTESARAYCERNRIYIDESSDLANLPARCSSFDGSLQCPVHGGARANVRAA